MYRRQQCVHITTSVVVLLFGSGSTVYGRRCFSASGAAAAEERQRAKELDEDRQLEEEEFSSLYHQQETAAADTSSLISRLGHLADCLDSERQRLRWVLLERRQLLGSPHGYSGLMPSSMMRVVQLTEAEKAKSSPEAAATCKDSLLQFQGSADRFIPLLHFEGTASPLWRPVVWWRQRTAAKRRSPSGSAAGNPSSNALSTAREDVLYIQRIRSLHRLSFYRRMLLIPKRNLWHAVYHLLWNGVVAVQNAVAALISYPLQLPQPAARQQAELEARRRRHERKEATSDDTEPAEDGALYSTRSVASVATGAVKGAAVALLFLSYGFLLSPIIHLASGAINSVYGTVNFFTGQFMFDAISGRWLRCTVLDAHLLRQELQREKRLVRAVGRSEFRRKKMRTEVKWQERMAAMGISMDTIYESVRRGGDRKKSGSRQQQRAFNPYTILNVPRSASPAAIKAQYKRLALIFHPDVASPDGQQQSSQQKFEEISRAYQVLSNPEKRRLYDSGGEEVLEMYGGKNGQFLSRTPEEVVQSVFGGEAFRWTLTGELLRSHWALRYEAQVRVSLHDLEELQSIRIRQIALQLARMADVHARRPPHRQKGSPLPSRVTADLKALFCDGEEHPIPSEAQFSLEFVQRCDAFISRLSSACFGKELLYEVGLAYEAGAQRFLRRTPFYKPKVLVTKKIFTGIDRVYEAFKDAKKESSGQAVARKVMVEYFRMEFDNVVADLHICLRFAVQNVCCDVCLTPEEQRRRCYAVWWMGHRMKMSGSLYQGGGREDDLELLAYIQQAATAKESTSRHVSF